LACDLTQRVPPPSMAKQFLPTHNNTQLRRAGLALHLPEMQLALLRPGLLPPAQPRLHRGVLPVRVLAATAAAATAQAAARACVFGRAQHTTHANNTPL
jgi:hypothetical protein